MTYFAPETEQQLTAAGLRPGRMCYFAGRSAAMGAVGAPAVAATFYNFNPALVARHVPQAWSLAAPAAVLDARFASVDAALRRMLGDDVVTSPEVAEAAGLARRAAEACSGAGRALAAAHLGLEWPAAPHLVLWHAVTVLREHRGDGHVALLLAAELPGVQALVSYTATGRGFVREFAQASRGFSALEWADAERELARRGLLDDDGALTPDGVALREQIEADTDRLAAGPWSVLGADGAARLGEIGARLVRALLAAGCFPDNVFAARGGSATARR
ncbi:hypothetical protein [Pseudonocardia sp. MH-G8]|uniref:SCO6745 family protein n=1 Tax=Pseudonocardia sp. MH-G8 TaxID=1854588 RepID=UPI000BA134F7|nr:hypothetical protein [Pseudonocardia sp. MH-G8]OZM84203.1 hypothetical protein CFP66_00080 [Pseudonocardia sp. MH-G8]